MDEVKQNKSHWAFWITVALLAVFVLYPLSFGPVLWLAMRYEPLDGMAIVYMPLAYLAGLLPPAGRAISESYLSWWAGGPVSSLP